MVVTLLILVVGVVSCVAWGTLVDKVANDNTWEESFDKEIHKNFKG